MKTHVIGRTGGGLHLNTAFVFPDRAHDGENSEKYLKTHTELVLSCLVFTPATVSHTPFY